MGRFTATLHNYDSKQHRHSLSALSAPSSWPGLYRSSVLLHEKVFILSKIDRAQHETLVYVKITNNMHNLFPLYVSIILSSNMFRTKNFIIRKLRLYTQHTAFFMHVYDVW